MTRPRATLLLSMLAFAPAVYAFAPSSLSFPRCATILSSHRPNARLVHCGTQHNKKCTTLLQMNGIDTEEEESDEDRKKRVREEIFWAKQRALAAAMDAGADAEVKQENQNKFAKRRLGLVSDTIYFSILIFSTLWIASSNPFVALSYLFGALSGTAYSFGLGKYVETIGGSVYDEGVEGAGVGQARFAFLILLFVFVGKFRAQGFLEIPSIMGFFTYQLATLSQGLREIDD